jgi:hypothetical protein
MSPYPPAPQALQVTGGKAPYVWTVDANARVIQPDLLQVPAILPPGLALNPATGVISGMPSTAGEFAFRVLVTDALGQVAAQNFCIHIEANVAANVVTTDLTSATVSPAGLAGLLVDPEDAGVAILNATFTGDPRAGGRFSGGGSATDGIGFDSGLILSSGFVSGAKGPNLTSSFTSNFGTVVAGDSQLEALAGTTPGNTHDAAILQFDFTPTCHADAPSCHVTFEYVFGSDEYHEFANSAYNDVFGFLVRDLSVPDSVDTNYAVLPGIVSPTPVSINNVNGGRPLGTNPHNAQFFRANRTAADLPGPLNVQADGLTVPMQFNAPVISGHTYHIKIGIADVTDTAYDSWVFLKAGSLKVTHVCPIVVPQ